MLEMIGENGAVALVGLLGGVVLGLAARLGRFCTLGAIEDWMYASSSHRLAMWGLAIGAAIMGAFGAMGAGIVDAGAVFHLTNVWSPLGSVVGGLMFGYGMAIAGNCGYGALARLGGGDIRSFVIVIIIGISAYVMASGPLAAARIWLFPVIETSDLQGYAHLFGRIIGADPVWIGLAGGAAIIAVSLSSSDLRARPQAIFWGLVVGLAVSSGWAGSAWIAQTGFDAVPVVSHSFSTPIGDAMLYAMLSSGLSVSFGMGSVVGVVAGAFLGSIRKGHFRWEACDDPRELRRQMTGAWLMGFGAVLAVGCSVGQGISAFAVLAFGAPVTLASIFLGAWLGLRQLVVGLTPAE